MLRPFLLILASLIAYSNSFHAALVFDGPALTFEDKRVASADVGKILTTNYWGSRFDSGLYRPVTTLSFAADYAGSGSDPYGYHVTNFSIHAAAVFAAYLFLSSMIGAPLAFWAALLWAVHPINTDAVTQIAGRADLISALCVFLGLWLYRRGNIAALAAVATVGMFSKESAVMLLFGAILCDAWCRQKPKVSGLVAIAAPTLLSAIAHLWFPMAHSFVDNPLQGAGFIPSHLTALSVLGKMVGLWFIPAGLSADYSFSQIPVSASVSVSAVLVVLFAAFAVLKFRTRAGFFAAFFLLAILPTSNLIVTSGSIAAERFIYLPGIGLAAVVAIELHGLLGKHAPLALASIALAFGFSAFARNQDYRNPLAFWRATAAASPNSFKARSQYAAELFEVGNTGTAVHEIDRAVLILRGVPVKDQPILTWQQAAQYYAVVGRDEDSHKALGMVADILNSHIKKEKQCKRR